MAPAARKAAHRRLANILFVQAAAERLPELLCGAADAITVLYPWGSLLTALSEPCLPTLGAIAALGRAGASLTALVNLSVFDDAAYCARWGLKTPPILADAAATRAAYGAAGIEVTRIDPDVRAPAFRTSWGVRLLKGGRRRVLQLEARIK